MCERPDLPAVTLTCSRGADPPPLAAGHLTTVHAFRLVLLERIHSELQHMYVGIKFAGSALNFIYTADLPPTCCIVKV